MHALILTHYFPPIGGPGARRMLGWVHGFTAGGHSVSVVTPEAHPLDPYYQPEERYEGPAHIERPAIFDPARLARGESPPKPAGASAGSAAPGPERRGLAARLRPWLLLPDQRRLANGPLVDRATKLIGSRAVVFTSSPYNSVHLAGLALKRRFGSRITWVADFRDDWFHPVFFPHPNAAYRAYNRRLERAVLRGADGLTIVSRQTLAKVRSRHAKRLGEAFFTEGPPSKWRWAPNGFDTTGIEAILEAPIVPRAPGAAVRLLFSGTLWQGHSLVALVAALDAVANRTGQAFRFEVAGRVIEPIPTPASPLVEVALGGWKPYEESLAATRAADLLLVHTGPERQDIKIKLFDAAAVRRPVLVLGPIDSATTALVKANVRDALVAPPDNQAAIERALERYLAADDPQRHAFPGVPADYDRVEQAKSLLAWAETLRG
jgi:glycosyltransferase involved in cell wall biosynthesis